MLDTPAVTILYKSYTARRMYTQYGTNPACLPLPYTYGEVFSVRSVHCSKEVLYKCVCVYVLNKCMYGYVSKYIIYIFLFSTFCLGESIAYKVLVFCWRERTSTYI